jgi:hypothetical protein
MRRNEMPMPDERSDVLFPQHDAFQFFTLRLLVGIEYVRPFCCEPGKHFSKSRLLGPMAHYQHVLRVNIRARQKCFEIHRSARPYSTKYFTIALNCR